MRRSAVLLALAFAACPPAGGDDSQVNGGGGDLGQRTEGAEVDSLGPGGDGDAGTPEPEEGADAGAGPEDASAPETFVDTECPAGQVEGPSGCIPVGVQGCLEGAAAEPDGLCRAVSDACGPSEAPLPNGACRKVGLPSCPEVFVDEAGLCRPRSARCAEGSFPVPSLGCVPNDGDLGCGEAPFGHVADADGTIWVDPAAAGAAGKGTKDAPVASLADAIALLPDGGRIVLAEGTHKAGLLLGKPYVIEGRCPSLVTLTGSRETDAWPAVLEVRSDVVLRGLHLASKDGAVVAIDAKVLLEGVHVEGKEQPVLYAGSGASIHVLRSRVSRKEGPTAAGFAPLVEGQYGGQTRVESSWLSGGSWAGVKAHAEGSVVEVLDSIVEGTAPDEGSDQVGAGVVALEGGRAVVAGSVLAGGAGRDVAARDPGSAVEVRESLLDGAGPEHEVALGVAVASEAQAVLDGVLALDHTTAAVAIDGKGSAAKVTGSLLAPAGGLGTAVLRGAVLAIESTALVGSVLGDGAAGLLVHDGSQVAAKGILVQGRGGAAVSASAAPAVVVEGPGSSLALSASAVLGGPIGVLVLGGAAVFEGSRIAGATSDGVACKDGSLVATGLLVELHGRAGLLARSCDGFAGASLVRGNAVGLDVGAGPPSPYVAPDALVRENEVDLGAGDLPFDPVALSPPEWVGP